MLPFSMPSSKISISLPEELNIFLKSYQKDEGISRSEAVSRGIEMLREKALAKAYADHAKDWEKNPDKSFWDSAALDDNLDEW